MKDPIRVVLVGLGPIGARCLELAVARPTQVQVVGVADVDPAKVGRDAGTVGGLGREIGVAVSPDASALYDQVEPDAVLLCTGSRLADIGDQIEAAAKRGIDLVSSAEELLFPVYSNPELARRLDTIAREAGATVVGTGVNPGFLMDLLPIVLSAAVYSVEHVSATRTVDAATRREPLQRKVGAGLTMEEWRERAATGRFGHVGMPESVALVGHALNLELDDIACTLEPVVSDRTIRTEFLEVKADAPAGIRNIGIGKSRGVERVHLDLAMYVGAREPRDTVSLQGDPSLELVIPGGTPGDPATAAILLNTLPRVVQAQPGLLTVLDIPPARCGW